MRFNWIWRSFKYENWSSASLGTIMCQCHHDPVWKRECYSSCIALSETAAHLPDDCISLSIDFLAIFKTISSTFGMNNRYFKCGQNNGNMKLFHVTVMTKSCPGCFMCKQRTPIWTIPTDTWHFFNTLLLFGLHDRFKDSVAK